MPTPKESAAHNKRVNTFRAQANQMTTDIRDVSQRL